MNTSQITLDVPDSVRDQLSDLAQKKGLSVEEMLSAQLPVFFQALAGREHLEERARRARPGALAEILARAPDVEPAPEDQIPLNWK